MKGPAKNIPRAKGRSLGPAGDRGQAGRRASFLATVRAEARNYFTADGAWQGPGEPPDCREWLWAVFAFVEGDAADCEFASRLILAAPAPGRPEYDFCVFANNHAVHLLATHAAVFSSAARARLEEWGRRALREDGSRQGNLQFYGYNDNMPAKATLGMILGGEYFSDSAAHEQGLWNLHQLRLLLARRGVISEHCSPTYSPLTLANLTGIAAHADHAEARTLAGAAAERIWAELLAHYHIPTLSVVGPYSRAYATDSVGHLSNLHLLIWLALGPAFAPDPRPELRAKPRLVIHHSGDFFFVLLCFAFVASVHYNPPPALVAWARTRRWPFRFAATSERGEGGAVGEGPAAWPAATLALQSFQTKGFAVGTSNGDWHNQAERWQIAYRRRPSVKDWAGYRHLTLRYVVDDDLPGRTVPSPRGNFRGEPDYVPEHGLHHTVQADAITLVVSRPAPLLAGRRLRRMGLCLVLPEHLNRVESLRWHEGHLWLRDGPFQLAIRPLGPRRGAGEALEVKILKAGAYRVVLLLDYAGAPRTFTTDELCATANGFVAVPATVDEITPREFRARVLAAKLTDYIWNNQRVVTWSAFDRTLELSHGLLSNGVRHAAVDGRAVNLPAWSADGLHFSQLPLVHTGAQPNPKPFPFRADGYHWTKFPAALFAGSDKR